MHHWTGYVQNVQLGISDYILQRPEWIWTRLLPLEDIRGQLHRRQVDGVICHVNEDWWSDVEALGIPVVDVSNWVPQGKFPRVLSDDGLVGEMAARHLMGLGLRSFGLVNAVAAVFSNLRADAFARAVSQAGHAISVHGKTPSPGTPAASVPNGAGQSLAAWVKALPKPSGVFATTDEAAANVLEACRIMRTSVPDELCVLGVDNDELIGRFTHPPLSSIALPCQKIGFEAARLLDELMSGATSPTQPMLFAPVGVVSRQSTDILAIPDDDVRQAVRFIRDNLHAGITVTDVLREVPVNRRYLERKFVQHVGRSPLQEIRRMRLEKARELLAGTDLSMPAVAKRSGFPSGERLANVFHQITGQTPTQYRRQFRQHE